MRVLSFFFFQAEDGIRDKLVTGVQTCALPICERRVRERGVLSLLASLPDPLPGRKPLGAQPIHEVHPIAETAAPGNGPRGADADLTPRSGEHVVVEPWPGDAIERRRLVRLIDDPHRHE